MDVAYRRTKNGRDRKYPQISSWKFEAKRPLGSPRLGCKKSMEIGLKKKHVRRTYETRTYRAQDTVE
jgi:hypothetical protein